MNKKTDTERKSVEIHIRLSPIEYQRIIINANACHMTVSQYIRNVATKTNRK